MPQHTENPGDERKGARLLEQLLSTKRLLPLSAATACAHVSVVVVNDYCTSYANAQGTAILGDVPNLLVSALLLVCFFMTLRFGNWQEKSIERASLAVAALGGICLLTLNRIWEAGIGDYLFAYVPLCFAALASATWGTFYWLRKVTGTSSLATSVFCFAAVLISTALSCVLELFGWGDRFLIAAVLETAQLIFLVSLRGSDVPSKVFAMDDEGFFPSYRGGNFTQDLLATVGISLFCISLPLGICQALIGWQPDTTTLASMILVCAVLAVLSVFWIRFTIIKDASSRIMRFWMVAQLFILGAVICHVALPDLSLPGSVLMRSSSLFLLGFTWFITVAFINYGWRSPLYYCIAGWFAFFFSQLVGRDASILVFASGANETIVLAVMAGFLLVADQLLLARYYGLFNNSESGARATTDNKVLMHGIMGLSASDTTEDGNESSLDYRRGVLMEKARVMGKQYLLNDREIEIIALYALGFTHRNISEEVYLSSNTVHTYIKRIYKKTNLHSRRELIDYMNEYL
jgi:DNA-binding CsgD family transcriptional regulator